MDEPDLKDMRAALRAPDDRQFAESLEFPESALDRALVDMRVLAELRPREVRAAALLI